MGQFLTDPLKFHSTKEWKKQEKLISKVATFMLFCSKVVALCCLAQKLHLPCSTKAEQDGRSKNLNHKNLV